LYSYCIPVDDGAAPNPYWGVLTLNICKPVIRRVAQVGDWVVGTGAKLSEKRDYRKYLVYAMKISDKKSMEDYEVYAKENLPRKIPNWRSKDRRDRLGDCIYDFSTHPPRVRRSVHDENNRPKDLRGKFTLLSDYFYYFGNKPIDIPAYLLPIVKDGQGHKSRSNIQYAEAFIDWIHSIGKIRNKLYAKPQIDLFRDKLTVPNCSKLRMEEAIEDEKYGECD
jgi:hypothetical protein